MKYVSKASKAFFGIFKERNSKRNSKKNIEQLEVSNKEKNVISLKSSFFFKQHKTDFKQPANFRLPRKVDRVILGIAYTLIAIGLVVVVSSSYAATRVYSLANFHFAIKHLIFCAVGLFCIRFFSTKLHWLDKFGKILWFASVVGLVAVLIFGGSVKGASRWISLFGVSFQPSEFAKIAVILEGAKYVEKNWKMFAITYIIPISLIILQPDLGNTVLISSLAIAQLITKRFDMKYILVGLIGVILLITAAYFLFDHVHLRINTFLNPTVDIFGAGYQSYKSFLAMRNGGLFGRGFGKGVMKDFLPDAHTDFVFCVIVEEFGVLGGLFVIGLFFALGYRVLKMLAFDEYIQMVQYSFVICILSQAWLNIASTLSLIPTKGLTLPLVSYGGSGMIMQGISFGILIAASRVSSRFEKTPVAKYLAHGKKNINFKLNSMMKQKH